ncbi:uncharacterized protein EV420DRAFT_1751524 [Desarmillaria tabescens]|uniref:Uncharacterized protein n=1 Tax=Armillaria tabescens TaxID=1929756 RepID=A0AA39JMQ0_ARMTA|nr:uncharacterized protein EV420DRAFT_1751524 [Desarmillaria tabescens]KAK0445597.1 hypothetical protein EV420DRAFT_1751524 [Desarmillaria tabescens]
MATLRNLIEKIKIRMIHQESFCLCACYRSGWYYLGPKTEVGDVNDVSPAGTSGRKGRVTYMPMEQPWSAVPDCQATARTASILSGDRSSVRSGVHWGSLIDSKSHDGQVNGIGFSWIKGTGWDDGTDVLLELIPLRNEPTMINVRRKDGESRIPMPFKSRVTISQLFSHRTPFKEITTRMLREESVTPSGADFSIAAMLLNADGMQARSRQTRYDSAAKRRLVNEPKVPNHPLLANFFVHDPGRHLGPQKLPPNFVRQKSQNRTSNMQLLWLKVRYSDKVASGLPGPGPHGTGRLNLLYPRTSPSSTED